MFVSLTHEMSRCEAFVTFYGVFLANSIQFAYAVTNDHLFGSNDEEWYISEADYELQLGYIEDYISYMAFLGEVPEYCHTFAQLIHSLVRVDPKKRNPEEAMALLTRLEQLAAAKLSAEEESEPTNPGDPEFTLPDVDASTTPSDEEPTNPIMMKSGHISYDGHFVPRST